MKEKDLSEYSAELFGLGGKTTKKEINEIIKKLKKIEKKKAGKNE